MPTYIITIVEATNPIPGLNSDMQPALTEFYKRRVELPDVATVIARLDQALNVDLRINEQGVITNWPRHPDCSDFFPKNEE